MKWIPNTPVISTFQPRLNVNDYETDLASDFGPDGADFSFEDGDFKIVSGFDNFVQKFKTVILSMEFSPSKDQNLFNQECSQLAAQLVSHEDSDPKENEPNGLGYSIESVNLIGFDEDSNSLVFTLNVTGMDNEVTIDVPINYLNHLQ